MDIGVERRLHRILPNKGSLIFPVDGGLIDGPVGALEDTRALLSVELLSSVSGLLGYVGLLKRLDEAARHVPFIANVSGSTSARASTMKVMLCEVEHAARCGADAVCYQIHVGAEEEGLMLSNAGQVISEASRYGLPVLITAYPRRLIDGRVDQHESLMKDDHPAYVKVVAHCVRVAVELGADIVKTTFPGDEIAVKNIVNAAIGVPVLIAGGSSVSDDYAESVARAAALGGAWGLAYGRQIYMSKDPAATASLLKNAMASVLSG